MVRPTGIPVTNGCGYRAIGAFLAAGFMGTTSEEVNFTASMPATIATATTIIGVAITTAIIGRTFRSAALSGWRRVAKADGPGGRFGYFSALSLSFPAGARR